MSRSKTLCSIPLLLLSVSGGLHAQTARVQVIHNCADAAANEVDVWLNDMLLVDDFAFRTATPFIDAPAGTPFTVGIAPGNSTDASESIHTQNFTLEEDATYIIVANGIVSPSGYSPSPAFALDVNAQGQETAQGGGTDVLVLHGSTDAPTVDVYESDVVENTVIDDLTYGEFTDYLELPTVDLTLQVRTADNTAIVAAYAAPLATLELEGTALTVLASGFLDPSANSDGAAFGLFVATPAGGELLPLPQVAPPADARVQVIHNSADAAAALVDVYVNGALALDDFAFRTATPYIDLPSGVDINIGIAPSNSTGAGDAIADFTYQLEAGATYVIVANGIVSENGYSPATPFDLYVTGGREAANAPGNTDVLVFHGATDAPVVDVSETAVLGGTTIVDDIAYGEFQGYLEIPAEDYVLQVETSDGTPLIAYQAPLAGLGLEGEAIVVLASGFLDPGINSDGEIFGLYAALAQGGPLVALPLVTNVQENTPEAPSHAWPIPADDHLNIEWSQAGSSTLEVLVFDAKGRMAMATSTSMNNGGTIGLDTSALPNGSYHVRIFSNGSSTGFPLIIGR